FSPSFFLFNPSLSPQIATLSLHDALPILAAMVVLIFFFPNVLNKYILKPAVYSVYPNFSFDISDIEIWHGFNTELMMTIGIVLRSEEHTSELQSRFDLVCRLLLQKTKNRP